MKQRVERIHPKHVASQRARAKKLADAIRELAEKCRMPALEVFGRLNRADWLMLGVITGQDPPRVPSDGTQRMILGRLSEHRSAGGVS